MLSSHSSCRAHTDAGGGVKETVDLFTEGCGGRVWSGGNLLGEKVALELGLAFAEGGLGGGYSWGPGLSS